MAVFDSIKRHFAGFRASMAWHREHGPKAPQAGEIAPDFELGDAKGATTIRLSQHRGKRPVALVFGSFT
jgi:hypothetical protein